MIDRVTYLNYPGKGAEVQEMQKEVNKILSADINLDFRFIVSFTSSQGVINNFVCKVYPRQGKDISKCLATLYRGDGEKMLYIRKMYLSGEVQDS